MRVDLRRAVLQGGVVDKREVFDLLFDRDLFVVFFVTIEIAQHDGAKRSNSRKMAAAKILLFCERGEHRDEFVALVENKRKGVLFKFLKFHRLLLLLFSIQRKVAAASAAPERPDNFLLGLACARSLRSTKSC